MALSDARRRRLVLEAAWTEAVGAALAAKVRCVGIRGGVLTVRATDAAWADAVRRLLPRIAGRLRGRDEALRVGRVRIEVEGRPAGPAEPLPPPAPVASPDSVVRQEPTRDAPGARLRAVARRLLERGDDGSLR